MSKQSLDALVASIQQHQLVSAQIKASTNQTLGEFYRYESAIATHELDLSDKVLAPEFEKILLSAGLELNKHYTDAELKKVTKVFRDNIISKVKNSKVFGTDGDRILVSGFKDNYTQVVQLLKVGMEGETRSAYNSFSRFILRYLSDNEDIRQTVGELDKKIQADAAFAQRTKFGFDVGHTEESSNIYSAVKASIFNSLRKLPLPSPLSEYNKTVKADLLRLQQQMEAMASDDEMMLALAKEYGILNKEELKKLVELSVGFVRQVASGEVNATLNVEGKLDKTVIRKIANQLKISVFPQYAKDNQKIGRNIEQAIGKHFDKRSNSFASFLQRWLSGVDPFAGKNSELSARLPKLPDFEGSPPITYLTGQVIYENLQFGKSKPRKYAGRAKSAKPKVGTGKPRPKTSTATIADFGKAEAARLKKLARTKQQPIVNIIAIINSRLAENIRANMGRSGGLTYRTGRLARSAKVLNGVRDKDGNIRLDYTYLKNPYQTFEVGYAKGTAARDPRSLISGSIREIAASIVLQKLRVVRV